jgi:protein-disulfide isomerase
MSFPRRLLIAAATLFALGACQKSGAGAVTPAGGDMILGQASAPITVIEYASTTCPHCKHFHETVFPGLKTKYIDTGKVKFVFREFPTPPEAIAVAEFQIARCAGKDKYFALLDTFFKEQEGIFREAQGPTGAKPALLGIARQAGMSEADFETCIADTKGQQAILDTAKAGMDKYKITGTPTLVIDETPMPSDKNPEAYNIDGLSKILDAKLAAKGAK